MKLGAHSRRTVTTRYSRAQGVAALGIVLFHLHHLTGINSPGALMFLDLRKFLKNDGRWDIVAWG